MTKAVFTVKVDPAYDDLPERWYHFPRTYLRQAEAAIGDLILYYEPRRQDSDPAGRAGRQAYFATARVEGIRSDPRRADHFFADIDPHSYVEFDRPVPFRDGREYFERGLRKVDGSTNKGAFGRAVRNIAADEYEAIVSAGCSPTLDSLRIESAVQPGLAEEPMFFERPIVERIQNKRFRDAIFARHIRDIYRDTCAMTGIRIVNGGNRAEMEAAHIIPVEENGPDSVRNGLALCRTVHWLFDRGFVSVADDHSILLAEKQVDDRLATLFRSEGRILVPDDPRAQPHPQFLRWHRENRFKGAPPAY